MSAERRETADDRLSAMGHEAADLLARDWEILEGNQRRGFISASPEAMEALMHFCELTMGVRRNPTEETEI